MDLISHSISMIKRDIAPEVLNLAFAPKMANGKTQNFFRSPHSSVSIDAVIRRQIIDNWVGVDVNLCSGVETIISLQNIPQERIDPWNLIYRIPKDRTDGRTITAVYSLSFGQGDVLGAYQPNSLNSSAMLDAAAGVLQSNLPWTQVQSAYVSLIGENTVLLSNIGQFPGMLYLRCLVTHEPNFSNIKPEYYKTFAELAVLAARAFVYTNTIVSLDEGAIQAGASIGRIREIIDGYADAGQLYKEHLNDNWKLAAHLSDKQKTMRTNRYLVGGRR